MSYDEEEARRSRVVVETPTARREVVSQTVRTPDRNGVSATMVGVLVVVAIALITVMVLFWMSTQRNVDPNANTVAQQQQPPTVVQQAPVQQPPVIIQQPAPATQPAPVIIQQPAGGATEPAPAPAPVDNDAAIQTAIDKQLTDDPTFSSLGLTATVMNAKVTLLGTVKTDAMKAQVERMARRIKGVKDIDNQISVVAD
ncbi:MAG TPA: BON domain-containing protein [Pyrinomonadaceae bacterium]